MVGSIIGGLVMAVLNNGLQLKGIGADATQMIKGLVLLIAVAFDVLNKMGTTIVVATHDIHLLSRVSNAQMMRLERGQLADPTGGLRYPPRDPRDAAPLSREMPQP